MTVLSFFQFENVSSYICAFWTFSEPLSFYLLCCIMLHCVTLMITLCSFGSGAFSTDGVITDSNNTAGNVTSVHCLSEHATSFAVLVDVAGGLEVCVMS